VLARTVEVGRGKKRTEKEEGRGRERTWLNAGLRESTAIAELLNLVWLAWDSRALLWMKLIVFLSGDMISGLITKVSKFSN
jgi:hypothetical protein